MKILDGVVDEALPVGCRTETGRVGQPAGSQQAASRQPAARIESQLTDDGVVPEGHFGPRQVFYQQAHCGETRGRDDSVSLVCKRARRWNLARFGTYLPASSALHLNPCSDNPPAHDVRTQTLLVNISVKHLHTCTVSCHGAKKKSSQEISDCVE